MNSNARIVPHAELRLHEVQLQDFNMLETYRLDDSHGDDYCCDEWHPVSWPWPHEQSFVESCESSNDQYLDSSDDVVSEWWDCDYDYDCDYTLAPPIVPVLHPIASRGGPVLLSAASTTTDAAPTE